MPISATGCKHSDFIVREHDRDQDRLVIHRPLQIVEIDQAVLLHRHVRDAVAVFLQALAGIEHGLMLGHRSNNVVALLAIHLGDALDGKVVALGSARGEDDFFCGRADQFRDALARCLHAFFRSPSERMIAAGCVAELLHEVRQHLFQHPRIHLGGGVIVHVNRQLHTLAVRVQRLNLCLGDLYIRAH